MIIVDSNVWIFAEVRDASEHPLAVRALRKCAAHDGIGLNVIITSEVFHKIAVLLSSSVARARLRPILTHPSVEWLEFSSATAERATALAEDAGIRINDALIAAQALDVRAKVLTDNVKDFKRVRGLSVRALR